MKDLQESLFYKIKFTVASKRVESDLLWEIILLIKDWMTNKHNKNEDSITTDIQKWTEFKNGGKLVGNGVKAFSECCFVENPFPATYWACKIIESPSADRDIAPRQWTTEIGIEPIDIGKINFSCIISYSDRAGFIGECDSLPSPTVPRIVRMVLDNTNYNCYDGIDKPSIEPRKMEPGDWLPFWERLKNNERTIPYVYISPKNNNSDKTSILINPAQIALATGGNAIVYYAENIGVVDEMDYYCPEDYKCYDGAIRIYYPNIDENQPRDMYRHRYLSARFVERVGESGIIQIMRRAFAQDVHFYDNFFRIEDCKAKRESIIRQKRLDELKQQHIQELVSKEKKHTEKVKSIENDALQFAEEAERKQLEAEDLAAEYEKENKRLKEENYALHVENESYLPLAKENADLKKVAKNRLATKYYPKSAEDIVNYFDASFCDMIAFSEDAIDSLKGCTIPSEELWKVFFALATIMNDLYINGSGDIYKEFRNRSAIAVSRSEGSMTRQDKKLMRQFEIEYNGETIDIEPHVTYPKIKQSIHFGFSKKDKKIIVGWCGEHKDNYSTQKVH